MATERVATRVVIVTGSRDWTDRELVESDLDFLASKTTQSLVVFEGGAPGADHAAGDWARRQHHETRRSEGLRVQWMPRLAQWSTFGSGAGPRRNEQMVEAASSMQVDDRVVLAYPLPDSRGTRDAMEKALRAGIRVVNRNS